MPKLEVLWRSFEKGNLMDSSGSDFEARVDSEGKHSLAMLLVEKSDLSDIIVNVSGGGEDGEGSAGKHSSHMRKQGTRKKVVLGEERRLRRKARGDRVVLRGHPLKGEKGRDVMWGVGAR